MFILKQRYKKTYEKGKREKRIKINELQNEIERNNNNKDYKKIIEEIKKLEQNNYPLEEYNNMISKLTTFINSQKMNKQRNRRNRK